jgi:HK97 family phage major capsid protein
MNTQELRAERARLIENARAVSKKAETEKRDMTSEEVGQFDGMMNDAEKVLGKIEREEKLTQAERSLTDVESRIERSGGFEKSQNGSVRGTEEYRSAFESYLRRGIADISANERRALSQGVDASGGYLVPSEKFVAELLKALDDTVAVRQFATKFQVSGSKSLGIPTISADPSDADWTTEVATGTEDSTLAFGKRSLTPSPLAKRVKASRLLLTNSAVNAEAVVRDRLNYKFAVTEEKAFLIGDGSSKPLGMFVANANGITTARDVTTASSTAVAADELFDMKYSLKDQYQARARWIMHRDLFKAIAKLKDENKQYLLVPGLAQGSVDTLLGSPVTRSEYAPNTYTAGLYAAIYGDLSFYHIADGLEMQIQRLEELYAEANQVGFIGRLECDGQPVLAEAFSRLKMKP